MLRNFSIRNQLLLTHIVVGILCIPFVIFTLVKLKQSNDLLINIVLKSRPRNFALTKMNENAIDFMNLLNLYKNKSDFAPSRSELIYKIKEVDKWESEYKKYTQDQAYKYSPEEQEIDDLERLINQLKDKFTDQAMLVINTIDNHSDPTVVENAQRKLDGYLKQLKNSIFDTIVKEFSFWNEQVVKAKQEAHKIIFLAIISICLLLFAIIIISIYLSRKIAQPIIYLRDIAGEISKGNLKKRVNINSENEIGHLGSAINNMIVSLSQAQNIAKKIQRIDEEKSLYLSLFPQKLGRFKGHVEDVSQQLKTLLKEAEILNSIEQMLAKVKDNPHFLELTNTEDFKQSEYQLDLIKTQFIGMVSKTQEIINKLFSELINLETFSANNEIKPQLTDIKGCLEFAVSLIENIVSDKKRIKSEMNNLPNVIVMCDPGKMAHAFTNVLMSSVQSISSEGEINVQAKQINKEIVIQVRDTGIGLSKDIQDELSKPILDSHPSAKNIGLYVAKEIILQNGGSMEIESDIGKGTNFIIKFPLHLPLH